MHCIISFICNLGNYITRALSCHYKWQLHTAALFVSVSLICTTAQATVISSPNHSHIPRLGSGASLTVTETGTLTSGWGVFVDSNESLYIINQGLIEANDEAITLYPNVALNEGLINEGTLSSNEYTILFGSGSRSAFLTNSGTITGNYGIYMNHNSVIEAELTNSGTIVSSYEALYLSEATIESINNSGMMISSDTTGLYLDEATVTTLENSGTITGKNNGIIAINNTSINNLNNSGVISGDTTGIILKHTSTVDMLENSGTIEAATAVSIEDDAEIAHFNNSHEITGDDVGIAMSGGTITESFTNSGAISGDTTGVQLSGTATIDTWNNSGAIAGNTAVSIEDGAEIAHFNNSHEITGDDVGIAMNGGTITESFTNSGAISGDTTGAQLSGTATIDTWNNSGTIAGNTAVSIEDDAEIAHFNNSYEITGDDAGIAMSGGTITESFTNSGAISGDTTGAQLSGTATIDTWNNSGTIAGNTAVSIEDDAEIAHFNNSGTITGSTIGVGISGGTITHQFTNSGTISGNAIGVNIGDDATLSGTMTNNGTIIGEVGISVSSGANVSNITNNGIVKGTGGTAIDLNGNSNVTLTLGEDSYIVGTIDFGTGSNNELSIDDIAAKHAIYRYRGNVTGFNVTPGTVAIQGDEDYVVVNRSGFAVAETTTYNTAIALNSAIYSHINNLEFAKNDSQDIQLAQNHYIINDSYTPWIGGYNNAQLALWVEAFNTQIKSDTFEAMHAYDSDSNGVLIGLDKPLGEHHAGLFVGGLTRSTTVGNTNIIEEVSSEMAFGGAYLHLAQDPYQWLFSVTVGSSDNQAKRYVSSFAGNEIASGNYNDYSVISDITLKREITPSSSALPLIAGLTLRYTSQFIDGYTETGLTTGNMTVKERNAHTAGIRFAVQSKHRGLDLAHGRMYINGRAGIEADYVLGKRDITITVLDQEATFESLRQTQDTYFFMGADIRYIYNDYATLYTEAEITTSIDATTPSSQSHVLTAGLIVNF